MITEQHLLDIGFIEDKDNKRFKYHFNYDILLMLYFDEDNNIEYHTPTLVIHDYDWYNGDKLVNIPLINFDTIEQINQHITNIKFMFKL